MRALNRLTAKFVPLPHNDVDTDQIIPAVYLKSVDKSGLVEGLFQRWRYKPDGTLNEQFPLNKEVYRGAEILLAGDNFGCGSSREHAPWALAGWGFRAIISTSFADIFRNNALKNGLLPVEVDPETHQELIELAEETTEATLTIDLPSQTLSMPGGKIVHFPIDSFSKACLSQGVDQLGYLMSQEAEIIAYETRLGK